MLGDTNEGGFMARGRSRRRDTTAPIANRRLPFSSSPFVRVTSQTLTPLKTFEDRRQWHPEGPYAPARSFSQPRHRLVVYEPKIQRPSSSAPHRNAALRALSSSPSFRVGFQRPNSVLICVRRQMRREIMFAKNKAGRGGQRRPRFTWYSRVRCK